MSLKKSFLNEVLACFRFSVLKSIYCLSQGDCSNSSTRWTFLGFSNQGQGIAEDSDNGTQARIQTGSSGFWKPVNKVLKNICVCKNILSHNSIVSARDVICHTLSVNLEHFPQCSKLYQSHHTIASTRARPLPFSYLICQIF